MEGSKIVGPADFNLKIWIGVSYNGDTRNSFNFSYIKKYDAEDYNSVLTVSIEFVTKLDNQIPFLGFVDDKTYENYVFLMFPHP